MHACIQASLLVVIKVVVVLCQMDICHYTHTHLKISEYMGLNAATRTPHPPHKKASFEL